ncbi:hypothetical protein TrVE_jg6430 [Triparma verrucosa]|uniref:Endonuclease/exonuclease/phosphatase domain-containing protein n=2 Tax=Triparma TaxID=722752 RepID=A0A9W7BFR6_9STRA|nr:hypothetical protein TrST_g13440 [Triparma strigata]GMI08819.1 hypothetical protein TrVE_jg6430 [Triparma verrucosa]
MSSLLNSRSKLKIASWNIAAINNNPFEYWLTLPSHPEYNQIMIDVENFILNPGDKDVKVSEVFTEKMFTELETKMNDVGWEGVSTVRKYWETDYSHRPIITGFLQDRTLGSKRLASMPDRITNTLNVNSGISCRPTVINMFEGDLGSLDNWWKEWREFMFEEEKVLSGKTVGQKVYEMLSPIKKSKYPAITEEEEAVSLPLQTLCCAVFDGVLVHMMNVVSSASVWQPMKSEIVTALNKQKTQKTLDIIKNSYATADIICLQEVSAAFIGHANEVPEISNAFNIITPHDMDGKRDQNSVILLRKSSFPSGCSSEITSLVESSFPEGSKVPVAKGDILALKCTAVTGQEYVVASFHGDTNGLATIPVLKALNEVMKTQPSSTRLIFGLDANVYEKGDSKKQDCMEFGTSYASMGYTSNWGDEPDPKMYTTYNARTYLQTQLNKACKSNEKRECGDVNPKDHILFDKGVWKVGGGGRDNLVGGGYVDEPFPTLDWPSDHGAIWCDIEEV